MENLDILTKLYVGITFNDNIVTVSIHDDIFISINMDGTDPIAWDSKGTYYENTLTKIIEEIESNPFDKKTKVLLILQNFRDHVFHKFQTGLYGVDVIDNND